MISHAPELVKPSSKPLLRQTLVQNSRPCLSTSSLEKNRH